MTLSLLGIYADSLRDTTAPTLVRTRGGFCRPLACARWLAPADPTDELALTGLRGPVLDVGCGPGRHLHALAHRGVFAIGVDLSPVAVGIARNAGATAVVASIFDELAGAGSWQGALLLDGNIGIGGDPERLLRRVAGLLAPGGEIRIELAAPGTPTGRSELRLERGGRASEWFPWATLSVDGLADLAAACRLTAARPWYRDGRWFASVRLGESSP